MPIKIDNARTDSYVGTFDCSNESDMNELKGVRRMVKNLNKDLRDSGYENQYYVKAQGRGHRRGVSHYCSNLPLQYADRVDAYIYKR